MALQPLGVSNFTIKIPGLSHFTLQLGDPQRQAARRIFVEMTTRTVTQPLDPGGGTLRAAIDSIYAFFHVVRDELKSMPPTPPRIGKNKVTLESIAHRMLNEGIRPYTTRWHPRLDAWEKLGYDEADWPLREVCRRDLDRMRLIAIPYAEALAEAADIPLSKDLIPEAKEFEPTPDDHDAVLQNEIERFDSRMDSEPHAAHRRSAWVLLLALRAAGEEVELLQPAGDTHTAEAVLRIVDTLDTTLRQGVGQLGRTSGRDPLDTPSSKMARGLLHYRVAASRGDVSGLGEMSSWLEERALEFEAVAGEKASS